MIGYQPCCGACHGLRGPTTTLGATPLQVITPRWSAGVELPSSTYLPQGTCRQHTRSSRVVGRHRSRTGDIDPAIGAQISGRVQSSESAADDQDPMPFGW